MDAINVLGIWTDSQNVWCIQRKWVILTWWSRGFCFQPAREGRRHTEVGPEPWGRKLERGFSRGDSKGKTLYGIYLWRERSICRRRVIYERGPCEDGGRDWKMETFTSQESRRESWDRLSFVSSILSLLIRTPLIGFWVCLNPIWPDLIWKEGICRCN